MRKLLFSVMTAGERPEVALHHRQDWFAHTDEFRRDYSAPAYVFELLRGALCHVSWRITRKSDVSLLPISFMLALQAGAGLFLIAAGEASLVFNRGVDLVAFAVFLLWIWSAFRKPWDLSFRWGFSTLLLFAGVLQLLFVVTIRPLSVLDTGTFLMSGLGAVLMACSSIRHKLILGSSSTAVVVATTGALLGLSRVAWDTRAEGTSAVIEASVVRGVLTFGLFYSIWRVWWAGQSLSADVSPTVV